MLPVGAIAPLFTAESTCGEVRLADYIGKKNVVLIFYPRDHTPVCTKQLCTVQADLQQFEQSDTAVFGVNPGSLETHQGFAARYSFTFPLIADREGAIRKLYDVPKMLGLIAQQRIVYVIDKAGKIAFAQKGSPATQTLLGVLR
ncbi:peroxiredoxin [Brevibacillus massiliensis]|jgi:peroxiredoxin Q/BCP|uniref:peroxiredoxin n=1 Tax=Brevibacillus massiliensis TaxID=1118054 RepID=UPI0002FDDB68|nr:peroxiredoxin [Brevibacillus massiliensis]